MVQDSSAPVAAAGRVNWLHPALSRFPPMDAADWERVSVDAQFYTRCDGCGFEERYRPEQPDDDDDDEAGGKGKSKNRKKSKKPEAREPAAPLPCLACGQRAGRSVVRHLLHDRGRCLDCGAEFDILSGPWLVVRCIACGSQRLDIQETGIEPPFPARFGERAGALGLLMQSPSSEPHVWGVDGIEDANRVKSESDLWKHMPQTHGRSYGVMLFAERLRNHCAYDDAMGRYLIANIEANIAQEYFRNTAWFTCLDLALRLFESMIDLAPDAPNRALAQHSFAMAAFSLFTRTQGQDSIGWPGLREKAIERAREAQATFDDLATQGMEGADFQAARIRWVLGDLLSVGSRDDDERRRAVTCIDQALENERLAKVRGFALRETRGRTLAELEEPTEDDLRTAIADLQETMQAGGSDEALAGRWRAGYLLSRLLMKHGAWKEAMPVFQRTASLAWQQFQALGDEQQMVDQSERFANVFEGLATLYTSVGWNDEALALIEITRCSSVRLYTMDAEEREQAVKAHRAKLIESLMPATLRDAGYGGLFGRPPSEQYIDDILEEMALGHEVLEILYAHPKHPTGLLTLLIDDDILTALLAIPVVLPEDPGKPRWKNERMQARLSEAQLAALGDIRHVPPGPFRERLIGKLCQRGGEALLRPLVETLGASGITRLLVSVPGWMSGLSLEAFGDDQQPPLLPGLGITVAYLPSIRLGSDLLDHQRERGVLGADGRPAARPRSVLFIGYGGADLDAHEAEHERIAASWDGEFNFIPGAEATKRRVLEALRGGHDIVHIQAHGTFDERSPMDSALHFVADIDDDSRRVTTFDLLNEVRFARAPLVVLSACSSAMTVGWRTGTYHGLLGSLLRAGAAGVIGTRWPVSDDGAMRFMSAFYGKLRDADVLPDQALNAVAQELRAEGAPRELWAAFGFFGMC